MISLELVTAVIVLITAMVTLRNNHRAKVLNKAVQEIHVLVNSRLTEALARIDQLTETLEGSDTDVPDDPAEYVNGG